MREMTGTPAKRLRAVLLFELAPAFKGPLLWAALASLVLLVFPVRYVLVGELSFNGNLVGRELRLPYVLAIGYSTIVFLTTLFTLCLCLDRTGTHYLRNNDLLILSRNMGRPAFYLAKIASVLIPSLAYAFTALSLFWEELYRVAGINFPGIFLLMPSLSLSIVCLVSLYFLMRNFLGNFMIFFLWLLALPVIYAGNMWRYYAGWIHEEGLFVTGLGLLPQFGGIHVHSLGTIIPRLFRDESWHALVNASAWSLLALSAGVLVFSRKRL